MKELLGVLVELAGDIFVVAGYTGQRLATLRYGSGEKDDIDESDAFKALCGNPKWIASFLVFALGQALELVALGLASESTVVAVGNLSLVFNAVASIYVFGEDFAFLPRYDGIHIFYQWDAFNLFLLIAGSALTVACAPIPTPQEESSLDAAKLRHMWIESPFIFFNITMVSAMLILGHQCRKNFKNVGEPKAPMFLASALAILSAFSVTLSKVVTELFARTMNGENQFMDIDAIIMTIIWISGLVAQLLLLNLGLRNFEQGVFVPMFETMSTSITIVFGVAYFQSYKNFHKFENVLGFVCGVLILIVGLYLSSKRHSPSKEEMIARLDEQSPRAAPRNFFDLSTSEALTNMEESLLVDRI